MGIKQHVDDHHRATKLQHLALAMPVKLWGHRLAIFKSMFPSINRFKIGKSRASPLEPTVDWLCEPFRERLQSELEQQDLAGRLQTCVGEVAAVHAIAHSMSGCLCKEDG